MLTSWPTSDGSGGEATPWPLRAPADHLSRPSSHFITKLDHAALVGFDLRQVETDVSGDLVEERDPITNQDREDRIAHFVAETETKAFPGDNTTSNQPD